MAASLKLVDSKENSVDRQKALDAALAQIDRAFGKGSAMKLGQMVSMDAGEVLPPELAEIMARLRDPDGGCPWDLKQVQVHRRVPGLWQAQRLQQLHAVYQG